jgi:hypothetical protein
MRYVIENNDGEVEFEAISDGESRYLVRSSKGIIPRSENKREYATSDGYHVVGLFLAYFGANDSREYLGNRIRVREIVGHEFRADDGSSLDRINEMLSDPEWGVGMLEDICAIVRSTGRAENPKAKPWSRH